MQNQVIGYTGLVLLVISFLLLLNKKTAKWFTIIDFIATNLLVIYAIKKNDLVFALVNIFISGVLFYRLLRGDVIQ